MSITERLMRPQDDFVAGNDGSPWKVVVTALAIVLIACTLGWETFQKNSRAWIPLGAAEGAVVDQ